MEGNVSQTDVRRQMFEERVRDSTRGVSPAMESCTEFSHLHRHRNVSEDSCTSAAAATAGRDVRGRVVHQFAAGRDKLKASSVRVMTQFTERLTVLFPPLCVANLPVFVNCNVGESVTPLFIST